MTAKALKDVLERVEAWPEEAQRELAAIALEIDAGLSGGAFHATPDELHGIDAFPPSIAVKKTTLPRARPSTSAARDCTSFAPALPDFCH